MTSNSSNRTLLASAATATALGIAFSVSGGQALGSWLTVVALVLLVFSLHRFGRRGPDAPMELEPSSGGHDQD